MIVGDTLSATVPLERLLTRLGHTVCGSCTVGPQAIAQAAEMRPDLLLINLGGNANAIEVAAQSRSRLRIPAIYLMDSTDEDLLRRAETTNPLGLLLKPVPDLQLDMSIRTALLMSKTERDNRKREIKLNRIVATVREGSDLIDAILDNLSDGVVAANMKGEFIVFTRVSQEIAGIGKTDSQLERWSETYGVFHPDRKTMFPSQELPLARAIRGESVNDVELFIRNSARPQGVDISVSSRPLLDESGMNQGGVVVVRDITSVKATEIHLKEKLSRLQDQSAKFKTIVNCVSDGVLAADENGDITLLNPPVRQFVNLDATNTNLADWSNQYTLYYPDRTTPVPREELPLSRAIRGESVNDMEIFVRTEKFPKGVYLSVSGGPLSQSSGPIRGGVVVFRDITRRMRAKQALLDAYSEGKLQILDTILHNIGNAINTVAIGMGSIKEELVANVPLRRFSYLTKAIDAHEIDFFSYLKDDPQGQTVIPFILALNRDFAVQNRALTETTDRVHKTVSQIVNIIQTERSAKDISRIYRTVNLEKGINHALNLLRDSLGRRGIDPVVDCRNAPKKIWIQEIRLHQMIVNFVRNSIEAIDELASSKPMPDPRIEIRSYTDGAFLVLDVIDNGIGIDQEHRPRIFSAGFTTKASGTGLGLHSIANFVVASGGRIQSLSAGINKGTIMRVKLRLTSVTPTDIGASSKTGMDTTNDEVQ